MLDGFQLTTTRLMLKPIRLEDFDSWIALLTDPCAMRFPGGLKSREEASELFRFMGGGWYFDGFSCFSVFEKLTGRWVGYAGIVKRDGLAVPEAVAGVVRDRKPHGYVLEAMSAILDWAFTSLGIVEVVSCVTPYVIASRGFAGTADAASCTSTFGSAMSATDESPAELTAVSRDRWPMQLDDDPPDFFAPRC